MSGWVAIKRGLADHEVMRGDFARVGWFVWMVDNAVWRDTQIDIGGKPHTVPRGSLCYSQRFMAEKFGVSTKALRTFLSDLERHGVVKTCVVATGRGTKTKRTQISLCNYDKYQSSGNKTDPKGKQEGNEEEQYNNIPVGTADKSASSGVVDFSNPKAMVWAIGKAYLTPMIGAKSAGGVIGKWLSKDEPEAILSAIAAAKKAGTQDPVPYITQALKPKHVREREERDRILNAWL